jgi:hypothetical protein
MDRSGHHPPFWFLTRACAPRGPWYALAFADHRVAHGFLLVALDRPDVFLSGDLALRRTIQRVYAFDHAPSEEEMEQLAERWRPYRSLAVSYLFASEYA